MVVQNAIIVIAERGWHLTTKFIGIHQKITFSKRKIFMAKYIDFKKVESSSESYIDLSGFGKLRQRNREPAACQ